MRLHTHIVSKSMMSLCAGIGLTLAMSFNSCSDVKFDNVQSASLPPGGLCLPGSQASGCGEDDPQVLVPYDDTFTIPASSSKVDVLLVLDNSGSMQLDLTKLAERLDGLVQILDEGEIDWQMCYVLTGGSVAGNWQIPGNSGKILKSSTANKNTVFLNTINSLNDNGAGNETGIYAIRKALANSQNANCFRNGAALTSVIISDEDEASCGGRCLDWQSSENPSGTQYRSANSYRMQYRELVTNQNDPADLINFIKSSFPNKTFINHSIVIRPGDAQCYDLQDQAAPAFYGVHYSRLQALSGGVLGNICANSYSEQLTAMGQRTLETVNSVTLRCAPVGSPTISISVPGVSGSIVGNKVVFSSPIPENSTVRVQYLCAE